MSDDSFVQELRDQYSKEFQIKASHDQKASTMMTMSGTTTILLGGFGAFLLGNINAEHSPFIWAAVITLIVEIVFMTATIIISARSYRLRNYRYAYSHDLFVKKKDTHKDVSDDNVEFDDENINKFRNADKYAFNTNLIKEYAKGILQNSENNTKKANTIEKAQWLFLIGIAIIPIFVGLLAFGVYCSH